MPEYRNIASHAVTLASGRPLAVGDAAEIDPKDPHDKALVDDGTLIKAENPDQTPAKSSRTKKKED